MNSDRITPAPKPNHDGHGEHMMEDGPFIPPVLDEGRTDPEPEEVPAEKPLIFTTMPVEVDENGIVIDDK